MIICNGGVIGMFIGREKELEFLNSRYNSNKAEFIVVYGRRRIGKTEVLLEFCKDKQAIFYSCKEYTDNLQLKSFSEKILSTDIPASKYISNFNDWESAFSSICDLSGDNKKVLIIDEFPYMCKGNSSIPSILQILWDEKLKNENIMLILCGSSMSFIEKEILAEKNPLYGRATGIYKMEEMPYYDAIKFFDNYSNEDKMIAYSILGGIPHYLKQFDKNLSLEDNIKMNILSKGSVLYSEVEFLLHQELREVTVYNSIIEAIALGNTSFNDIYVKTQIDKQKLSVYIKNLIDLKIIEREFPALTSLKEKVNVNRGLYSLVDNYFCFWYSFVYHYYTELERGDVEGIWRFFIKDNLHKIASRIFEKVCIDYLMELNKLGELPFYVCNASRWWGNINKYINDKKQSVACEIDILASDKNKKQFTQKKNFTILIKFFFHNIKYVIKQILWQYSLWTSK